MIVGNLMAIPMDAGNDGATTTMQGTTDTTGTTETTGTGTGSSSTHMIVGNLMAVPMDGG
jgi:hypothetical protein